MRGPALKVTTSVVNGGKRERDLTLPHFITSFSETVSLVNYDGLTARIVRPNIECTNGYIHLIDKVVVKVGSQAGPVCRIKLPNSRDETSRWEAPQI